MRSDEWTWEAGPDDYEPDRRPGGVFNGLLIASLASAPIWLLLLTGRYGAAAILVLAYGAFMAMWEVAE